ncbi:MAG: tetratricopeptide repeat protein [Planctomycetes bacterium]|nr:tetratricopeptide repeat protein [Planctomycetota bacterium]
MRSPRQVFRRAISLVILSVATCVLATSARAQGLDKDSWVGVKIMPKLNAQIGVDNRVLNTLAWRLPYTVQDVEGYYLYVGEQQKGWIHRRDALTLDEAPRYYTGLINDGEQLSWALNNRAAVWTFKGEFDLAIADYNDEMRLNPGPIAYNNRGYTYYRKGDYDRAINDFNQALRQEPNHRLALCNRGASYQQKGDYEAAMADYNQAIRASPNFTIAYALRGHVWRAKQEYDRATLDYQRAFDLDKNCIEAYAGSAWIRAACPDEVYRDAAKALNNATKACELTEFNDPEKLDALAAAQAESGDFAAAQQTLKKALEYCFAYPTAVSKIKAHAELYRAGKPCRE